MEKPFNLPSGLKLSNRLVKSAMTEDLSDTRGFVTNELINLYDKWSKNSGLGVLISGNVQVDRRHLERARNVCLDKNFPQTDYSMAQLRKWTSTVKQHGTKFICQLAHAGRQSNVLVSKKAYAPSNIPTYRGGKVMAEPVPLKLSDIQEIIEKFGHAAKICQDVGFNGVQLHAAHGYLISSFLNPLANNRTDCYGGNLFNRSKLLIEIIRKIKEISNNSFSISIKLNSADFQRGGFTIEEASQVALLVSKENIDFLEISGGNYESIALLTGNTSNGSKSINTEGTHEREAYFLNFAKMIKTKLDENKINLPLMCTGGFRSREVINKALLEDRIDLIGIGRPLCTDISCTKKLLEQKIDRLPEPEKYWRLNGWKGFDFLLNFSYFSKLTFIATQATLQHNLFILSQDKAGERYSNNHYPDIEAQYKKRIEHEKGRASKLVGYRKDDDFIQDYLKGK